MTPTQLKTELAQYARKWSVAFSNWQLVSTTDVYFTINGYDIEVDLETNQFINHTTGEHNVVCEGEGYANDIGYLTNCA